MAAIFGQVGFGRAVSSERKARSAANIMLPKDSCVQWVTDGTSARIAVRGGPPQNPAGADQIAVAFDGTLHALDDLRNSLAASAVSRDSDLISQAWLRWGTETPNHFFGDYAFAINEPLENRLTLVRDHVGSRPLYWHWADGVLSFASFLPVLLELLPEKPKPDETAVGAFLRWPVTLRERTFFSGIRSLLPGHMLLVNGSGPKLVRWWQPALGGIPKRRELRSLVDEFESLCETAVSERLDGVDAPVGAHLSGGIDSSAVAFLAQEHLVRKNSQLTSVYTWSPRNVPNLPDDSSDDERLRVARLAGHLGVDVRFGNVTASERLAFLQRPIELEGIADLVDEVPIQRSAQKDGIGVLLSGWGGDEAFSSMAHELPAWMLRNGRLNSLLKLARRNGGFRRPDRMARYIYDASIRPFVNATLRRHQPLERGLYLPGCYLSQTLLDDADAESAVPRMAFEANPVPAVARFFQFGHIGERMSSWAAMGARVGIDYRYPLTDRRIVEFMLGLSPEHLWADGYPRYFARALMKRRTRDPFPKADPANEAHRMSTRKACWAELSVVARAGAYDGACEWLDMPRLRRDLVRGPQGHDQRITIEFARIVAALRIWHFAERHGAVEGKDATVAEPD